SATGGRLRITDARPAKKIDDDLARLRAQFQQPVPRLRRMPAGVGARAAAAVERDILYFRIGEAGRDAQIAIDRFMCENDGLAGVRTPVAVGIDEDYPAIVP